MIEASSSYDPTRCPLESAVTKQLLLIMTTDFFYMCNFLMHSLETSYKTEYLLCTCLFCGKTNKQTKNIHTVARAAAHRPKSLCLTCMAGRGYYLAETLSVVLAQARGQVRKINCTWGLARAIMQYITHRVAKNLLSPLHRSTSVGDQLSEVL